MNLMLKSKKRIESMRRTTKRFDEGKCSSKTLEKKEETKRDESLFGDQTERTKTKRQKEKINDKKEEEEFN